MLDQPEYNRHLSTFGEFLRYLRERAEFTQSEFGRAVNYGNSMIGKLESNRRAPDVAVVLARFIPALHLEPDSDLAKRLIALAEKARTSQAIEKPDSEAGRVVGRDDELREAQAQLKKAALNEGQVLILSGEPGIGKTRLSLEVMARARPLAFQAFISEHYAEGNAPYAAVSQLVRQVHADAPDALRALPPSLLAELTAHALDLRAAYPNAAPASDPNLQQHNLLEGVAALCEKLTQARPLIWLFEDVHWADSGSLWVLRQIARRLRKQPSLLIVTHRHAEIDEAAALREVLTDLYRERGTVRLRLDRLSQDHTRALLRERFADAGADVAEAVYRETEGNPFYIEEICKALIEDGKLELKDGRWSSRGLSAITLPATLRETIQTRVKKLPAAAQACLQMGAVIGREFDIDILQHASDLSSDEVYTGLETAERTQMISEIAEVPALTFAFAHALIPAALTDGLSALQRKRHHLRVAQALEALRPDKWENLAYHYRHAGQAEQARSYALRAGDRARHAYAQAEAARNYRAVIELDAPPAERAYALTYLSEATCAQGRYADAQRQAEEALGLYRGLGDVNGVAHAYALVVQCLWTSARYAHSLGVAQDGLAELATATPTPAFAQLYYQAARANELTGHYAEAEPLLHTALAIAGQFGLVGLRAQTLIALGKLAHLQRRHREAEAAFRQALALAESSGQLAVAAGAHEYIATVLVDYHARMAEAREHYDKAAEAARRAGIIADLVNNLALSADTSLNLGEFAEAERRLAQAREWMEDLPDQGKAELDLEYVEAYLCRCRGEWDVAIERLQVLNQRGHKETGYAQVVGRNASLVLFDVWLELGEFVKAEKVAQGGIDLDEQHLTLYSIHALSRLCSVRAYQGRSADARKLLTQIQVQSEKNIGVLNRLSYIVCEARVTCSERDWTVAFSHYMQAMQMLSESGLHWRKSRMLCEWAETYLERNHVGDIQQARQLLTEALTMFERMGAPGYVTRIQSRLAALNQHGGNKP